MQVEKVTFQNVNKGKPGWSNRDSFACTKYTMVYEEDKHFIDSVIEKSEEILKKLNAGGANTSLKRDDETRKIDAISGFLAEAIALYFYGDIGGDENVYSKEATSSYHQIDLNTVSGKTIEVRSSFVFGFPNIPLFKLNKEPSFEGHASYNIPCTYTNGYKKSDISKDFYTLIMFPSKKEDFLNDIKKELTFYVTGTATKSEVINSGGYASLKTNDIATKTFNTSYKVVPIHKSLDVSQLEEVFNN